MTIVTIIQISAIPAVQLMRADPCGKCPGNRAYAHSQGAAVAAEYFTTQIRLVENRMGMVSTELCPSIGL